MQLESEDVEKELEKLKWPKVEADTAPSAMVPPAIAAMQKFCKLVSPLLAIFAKATNLTPMQTKILVELVAFVGMIGLCLPVAC